MNYRIFISALFTIALNGCMQAPTEIPLLSPQIRTKYIAQLQNWQVKGRAAIRNGQQGHNLSIEWQQNGKAFNIRFFGPLGAGSVHLVGKPGTVTLTTSDGKSYSDTDPENLLLQHLGWHLPFAQLEYWIKGEAAPSSVPSQLKRDSLNQIQLLVQDGWKIEYQSYVAFAKFSLPEKLSVSKGAVKLKLVIQQWE